MKHILQSDKENNLIFDAISIMKNILFDSYEDKLIDYCDFGRNQTDAQETPAT